MERKKGFVVVLALVLVATIVFAVSSKTSIAGSYRCVSANAGGVNNFCRLYPPFVLKSDGTYGVSSEKGKYTVKGTTVKFSASKLRGLGTIVDGNKLRFEYKYKGLLHVVTYLKEQTRASDTKKNISTRVVETDLSLIFPEGYGIDYFNVVELVPPASAKLPTYQAIAYALDKRTLKTYYNAQKGVMSGYLYDMYASTGTDRVKVGTLDLRSTKNSSVVETIQATP